MFLNFSKKKKRPRNIFVASQSILIRLVYWHPRAHQCKVSLCLCPTCVKLLVSPGSFSLSPEGFLCELWQMSATETSSRVLGFPEPELFGNWSSEQLSWSELSSVLCLASRRATTVMRSPTPSLSSGRVNRFLTLPFVFTFEFVLEKSFLPKILALRSRFKFATQSLSWHNQD